MKKSLFVFILIIGIQSYAADIRILFTNSANAKVENCLCPINPLGALEKRAYFIETYKQTYPDAIVIDNGDNFLDGIPADYEDIILKTFQIAKYDIINLGDQDIAYGSDIYLEQKGVIKNYQEKIVFKKKRTTISVLPVLGRETILFYPEFLFESYTIDDNENAIKQWLESSKKQTIKILLSHSGYDRDLEYAHLFSDIDLIISGHSQTLIDSLIYENNIPVVQAGGDAAYVGEIILDSKSKEVKHYEIHPMHISKPNHPDIVKMIKSHKKTLYKKSKIYEPGFSLSNSILVSSKESCSSCHTAQTAHWKTTAHATAFESLEKEHKDKNLHCVPCHVSGFFQESGFWDMNLSPGMENVLCTECHHFTGNHSKNPKKNQSAAITKKTCIRCHDSKNDAEFDFNKDLLKITHPK